MKEKVGGYKGNRIKKDVEMKGMLSKEIKKDKVENDKEDGNKEIGWKVKGCG